MMTLVIFYASIVFFLVATSMQLIRFAGAPVHLRWEIYRDNRPGMTANNPSQPRYGLSYKLKSAALDIILLRAIYRQRRTFWLFLYVFHLGLWGLIFWHVWLFALPLAGYSVNGSWSLSWGHWATGFTLAGGLGAFVVRIVDKKMRAGYPFLHYVKWVLILTSLAGGLTAVYFHFGNSMTNLTAYVSKQLEFDLVYKLKAPLMPSLHVLMASVWLVYLPFSHAMRLVFRYYHELRWDFVPNTSGGRLERTLARNLTRRVSWAAPHIGSGHSWAELAVTLPQTREDSP